MQTYKCNINDEFAVDAIIKQNMIDTIVNFAAESHVDNSILNPDVFFETNIIGCTKLLNIAKKYNIRFHQISTDEVYGETTPTSWSKQKISNPNKMPLIPSSPYSSAKSSADMIALSYHRTYGTKVTISRCSNNFGPWQHPEKLIGTVITKALNDKNIPVYGKGNQKRHWIHVDDHNHAIMKILESGEIGKIYNIGPSKKNWITNITLIKFILNYLGKPRELIEHIQDRLGHDTSYFIPQSEQFETQDYKKALVPVIEWYKGILNKEEKV